jgi:hypothetical protein
MPCHKGEEFVPERGFSELTQSSLDRSKPKLAPARVKSFGKEKNKQEKLQRNGGKSLMLLFLPLGIIW